MRNFFRRIVLPVSVLPLTALLSAASAQSPGEVLWYQKISKIAGGGPPTLSQGDQFGRGAAVLGDLDGDGVVDLIVGAPKDDDGGTTLSDDYGAAWILFMQSDGRVASQQKISMLRGGFTGTLDPGDEMGRAVSQLGDLDGDGVLDAAVSANYDDDGSANAGAVYILFLNTDGTVRAHQKISENEGGFTVNLSSGDQFGRSIEPLGDLDGDGVIDIIVGATNDDESGTNRGAAYVLFLNSDGTVKDHQKITEGVGGFSDSLSDRGEWGFDFGSLGDLDGDGVIDIVVASPDQKTDGNQIGAVWILYLNTDGTVKAEQRITEGYAGFTGDLDFNDEFGACVDVIGDLDGDGVVDLAVGAGKDDDGVSPTSDDRGAVWILFLNADGTVKGHQKISQISGNLNASINDEDRFGTSLAAPGDLSGDGIPDLFVGARFDDDGAGDAGAMYFLALNDGTVAAPSVNFSGAPTSGEVPLAVTFIDTSTGNFSEWLWDFGDGSTSTLQNPTHVYTADGLYDVTLTITGVWGQDSKTRLGVITVDPPPAPAVGFSAAPLVGEAPLDVTFSDETAGQVDTWAWDFGDGQGSSLQSPVHTYTTAGTYTVTLTATGPGGSDSQSQAALVTVTEPAPVAAFAGAPTAGVAPLDVTFTDASTGTVDSWAWDFGDGNASNLQHPLHTYVAAGTYTVSLTASGPGGADTATLVGYVTVDLPPAPVAAFTGDSTAGTAPLTVSFTDLSSGAIDTWAWDFGDGGTSTLQDPVHTYTTAGTFSVQLSLTGPGGADALLAVDLVTVDDPPVPVAAFALSSRGGASPLQVDFTDFSMGTVDAWSWDFGDGVSSTLQHPAHTYLADGVYDVSLTVTGPGGADTATQSGAVLIQTPNTGIVDGDFEAQLAGTTPTAPWLTVFGGAHLVQPVGLASDDLFPLDGTQWLELAADGTAGATPPSVPGGATDPAQGGAGVFQAFTTTPGTTRIDLAAAFLFDGPLADASANDWMSIDVSDGTTTHNLYYADGFSSFPNVSAVHGLAMTDMTSVGADLAQLFPGFDSSTVFLLIILVGDGGDGSTPSKGYVDAVRLGPAPGVIPLGCGVNPAKSFTILSGAPSVGTTITFGVDNPLGTQSIGSLPVAVISLFPTANTPCGTLVMDTGMGGVGTEGELLLSLPALLNLVGSPWTGPGNHAAVSLFLPNQPALVGLPFYVQGAMLDNELDADIPLGLADAYKLIVGP